MRNIRAFKYLQCLVLFTVCVYVCVKEAVRVHNVLVGRKFIFKLFCNFKVLLENREKGKKVKWTTAVIISRNYWCIHSVLKHQIICNTFQQIVQIKALIMEENKSTDISWNNFPNHLIWTRMFFMSVYLRLEPNGYSHWWPTGWSGFTDL